MPRPICILELLLSVLVFVLVAASAPFTPVVDGPFQDPYAALRWTIPSHPRIADWPQLPIDAVVSLQVLRNKDRVMLLGKTSLWIGAMMRTKAKSEQTRHLAVSTPSWSIMWLRLDVSLGLGVEKGSAMRILRRSTATPVVDAKVLLVGPRKVLYLTCSADALNCTVMASREGVNLGHIREVSGACGVSSPATPTTAFVGSETGLHAVEIGKKSISIRSVNMKSRNDNEVLAGVDTVSVLSLSDVRCRVAVGSKELHRLFVFDAPGDTYDRSAWKFFWVRNSLEENVTAVTFRPLLSAKEDKDSPSIFVGSYVALNTINEGVDWTSRVGGREGLPYGNITCALATRDRVFLGTSHGVCVWDLLSNTWHYFASDRFVHGERVVSLDLLDDSSVDGTGGVVVLTESGGSIIDWRMWENLEEKAAMYERMMYRHDYNGLTKQCGLHKYGDLSSWFDISTDNDGSWTGAYLDAEIFRYAVTKAPEARVAAMRAFEGMKLLMTVSGQKGFPARSVLPRGHRIPGGEWFNSTVFPEFEFKADTSSDEVDNHVLSYVLFHELLAESPEEKKIAATLLDDLVGNIATHEWYLMDYGSHHHTTWGIWNPTWLNDGGDDWDTWGNNRGLNSLEIISYLLSAYYITGKEMYLHSFETLATKYGYVRNIVDLKIMATANMNHFDDELQGLSALPLQFVLKYLKGSQFDQLRLNFKRSASRLHSFNKQERSAFFEAVYGIVVGADDFRPDVIAHTLRTWPQELIAWPIDNSKRMDIELNPEPQVREELGVNEQMDPLPYNERGMYRWDRNPYHLHGGNGKEEYDPGAFLFPYWLSRYHGFIVPQQKKK